MKNENKFQPKVIEELEKRFPGCMVLKNDPTYIQGVPDLIVLIKKKWFALETKRSKNEPHRPNQDYYINKMNSMSGAWFIYPENLEEVMNAIQRSSKFKR